MHHNFKDAMVVSSFSCKYLGKSLLHPEYSKAFSLSCVLNYNTRQFSFLLSLIPFLFYFTNSITLSRFHNLLCIQPLLSATFFCTLFFHFPACLWVFTAFIASSMYWTVSLPCTIWKSSHRWRLWWALEGELRLWVLEYKYWFFLSRKRCAALYTRQYYLLDIVHFTSYNLCRTETHQNWCSSHCLAPFSWFFLSHLQSCLKVFENWSFGSDPIFNLLHLYFST